MLIEVEQGLQGQRHVETRFVTSLEGAQMVVLVDNIVQRANNIIDTVSQRTDRIILFYSGGKDSIALLHLLSPKFKEVHIVFMYFVKGLHHVDKYLNDAVMRYPNVTLHQIPHWILTYVFQQGLYCNPVPSQKLLKLSHVEQAMRKKLGIDYVVLGMKKADSLNRRLMLKGFDGVSKNNTIYPLDEWTNKDVIKYIEHNKLPKPINYGSKKASSGITFDVEVFRWLRKHYPEDLQKIYHAFPHSKQILFEYDNKISKVRSESDPSVTD